MRKDESAGRLELETILESIADGLIVYGPEGDIRRINDAARAMLGMAPAQERMSLPERLRDCETADENGNLLRPESTPSLRALRGETVRNQVVVFARSGGARRWLHWSAAPLRAGDGAVTGAVATFTDLTSQHELEERLRRSDERAIGQLQALRDTEERLWSAVDSLSLERRKLREADHRKDEFLAILSHELRNPLTPIRNGIYVLERAAPESEQARKARRIIERQTSHMTRLIDDLLDLTRIASGRITLKRERVDLNELLRACAEDHRGLFEKSGVRLDVAECAEPLRAHADPTRLAQVVGNLLANAAKFTPPGGHTTLSLEVGADDTAVIRVTDDGVGMTSDTLARLFDPFVQADQTIDRGRGGLGLGLTLVKGRVEMHGGTGAAESRGLGLGTELTVTLPLDAPARLRLAVVPPPEARAPVAGGGRRVLVVEDNADAAESLREALELGGHEVEVAYSGTEGLEKVRALEPEVVLCDIGLPGMDGYAIARAVRADPRLRSTYLVALSGYALEADVDRAAEAGFDLHVAKPPSIEALEDVLARARNRATA